MARLQEEGTEEENQQLAGSKRKDCTPSAVISGKDNVPSTNKRIQYGAPIAVETAGTFPQAGSILGPYFCLGTLGKGTFSSIHKCINLDYAHRNSNNCRLAAAKVELSTFANSGVLMGEALVLHFLDESLPRGTVPVYMGHYTAGEAAAALVMEYLPGEDMHQLRENRNSQSPTGKAPRRLTIEDAVYLTADVMLPLLEQMHKVGIVHRDVKPSNCVRSKNREFCMVDFGLSKSIVVPMDSGYADTQHPWPAEQPWLIPPTDTSSSAAPQLQTQPGCFRKERASADFRGTSMYASPRVHQGRDYCPRDDCWSLLYVFCDLVSGGLPWMSNAANRDREMCQKIKERIHGLTPTGSNPHQDESERLLMGDAFHVRLYHHQKSEGTSNVSCPAVSSLPPNFPQPLDMFQDKTKIILLRQAFAHLAKLQFWDTPDYALIRRCIRGFLDEEGAIGEVDDIEIEWSNDPAESPRKKKKKKDKDDRAMPRFEFRGQHCDPGIDQDPLVDSELFEEVAMPTPAEAQQGPNGEILSESQKAVRRLPLERQFWIAQMEYHAEHKETAAQHIVLKDWMKVAIPLLYKDWDAKTYESGGHRSVSDGYRREFYLELVEKCLKWAKLFDNFSKKEYLGYYKAPSNGIKAEEGEVQPSKKRQIFTKNFTIKGSIPSDHAALSKVLFGLKTARRAEKAKSFAPPPLLSFGNAR